MDQIKLCHIVSTQPKARPPGPSFTWAAHNDVKASHLVDIGGDNLNTKLAIWEVIGNPNIQLGQNKETGQASIS